MVEVPPSLPQIRGRRSEGPQASKFGVQFWAEVARKTFLMQVLVAPAAYNSRSVHDATGLGRAEGRLDNSVSIKANNPKSS